MPFEEWVETTNYSLGRKNQLRMCYKRMLEQKFELRGRHNKWTKVKCFIKDETYDKYKDSRAIYARVDEFKCIFGPYCKQLENRLYQLPEFIKHVPVISRAKYVHDRLGKYSKFLATDYTGYECHFTPEMMCAVEMVLYNYMFCRTRPEEFALLNDCCRTIWSTNRCEFKEIKANIRARRMSGEMNTSLGNGFTNFIILKYIMEKKGISEDNYSFVVEGDDCLCGFNGEYPTTEDYANVGFTVKIEQHEKLETASFCGLVFSPENFISIANPLKIIMNTGYARKKYVYSSDKTRKELLRAKGFSICYQYSGVPILQEYGRMLLRNTEGSRFKFDDDYQSQLIKREMGDIVEVNKPIEMSTRLLMEKVFSFTIAEQHYLEKLFSETDYCETWFCPIIYMKSSEVQRHYFDKYVVPDCIGKTSFLSWAPDFKNAKESSKEQSKEASETEAQETRAFEEVNDRPRNRIDDRGDDWWLFNPWGGSTPRALLR